MGDLTSNVFVRAAIVAGLTWAAWKYLPLGGVGKTIVLSIGSVATTAVVAGGVPLLGQVLSGQLPGAAA